MANKFAVLETLKSLDFPMEGCNDFISTDVTEMDLQLQQSPCSVLANDSVSPSKKARYEKIEKKVTFNLPITTEKDKEQCEIIQEQNQTKVCGSLPILGKAQRSIYTFMLSMRMEQQLERIQFSSTMYSKGSTSKPITPREPFFVGPPPALKLFTTLEPSIVKNIEALTGSVTHVSSGLLQSNKALFKETGAAGAKHLLATPNPAITNRALLAFQQQQSDFDKATFVVLDNSTTKRLFKA